MLVVPSGMAKCTPPLNDGAAAVAMVLGRLEHLGKGEKKSLTLIPAIFFSLRAVNHSTAAFGNTQLRNVTVSCT